MDTSSYSELDVCGEMTDAFKKQAELLTKMNMDVESDLVEEVLQLLEEVCIILEGIRKSLDKDDEQNPRSEKEQRQPQSLLHDDLKPARMKLPRYSDPSTKFVPLTILPESLDDSEATHAFQLIYQDLKSWVERHYTRSVYVRDPNDAKSSDDRTSLSRAPCRHRPEILHMVHGEIFERIFTSILAPFVVGTSHISLDHHLRLIDKEVQQLCSVPDWQDWRSILSNAISSHEKESIEKTCDDIIYCTEARFGQLSETNSKERWMELKQIIRISLDFKKKLECQGNVFYFWWSPPGAALCEERMVSTTGQYPSNGKVGRTLWPMFYRHLSDEWVILAKEVVLTSPGSSSKEVESPNLPQSGTRAHP